MKCYGMTLSTMSVYVWSINITTSILLLVLPVLTGALIMLISDIHFGGFGKIDSNLIKFVRRFKIDFNMELDLIYSGKLFYSLFNMIKNNAFDKRTKILVIHTGGLQGLNGFNFSYS